MMAAATTSISLQASQEGNSMRARAATPDGQSRKSATASMPTGSQSDPSIITIPPPPDQQESWYTHYILTPLTMVSFLLSLFLIDSFNLHRLTSTASAAGQRINIHIPSFFTRSSHASPGLAAHIRSQSPAGSPAARDRADGLPREGAGDSWHVKKGKIFRMELVDAFELRRAVVVGIVACAVFWLVGIGLVLGWLGRGWATKSELV